METNNLKICSNCGKTIKTNAKFCINCKTLLYKNDDIINIPTEEQIQATVADNKYKYRKSSPSGIYKADVVEIRLSDLQAVIREASKKMYDAKVENSGQVQEKEVMENIIENMVKKYEQRMVSYFNKNVTEKYYETEEKKLEASIGMDAWSKLDRSSQTLLVSARLIYNNLLLAGENLDYSGACLLALKAIEVELFKRFYSSFITYLKDMYPGKENMKQWPTALVNKYDRYKPTKKFTLIGVTYILCYVNSNNNTETQNRNNREKLLEFASNKLYRKGYPLKLIESSLLKYAKNIESYIQDPHNPSAFKEPIKMINARDSNIFLTKTEAFLKNMLETFIF